MLFNSIFFIFAFLPATCLGYFILVKSKYLQSALVWLVLCSLFFYGWWNPAYLILLMLSMLFNFIVGRLVNAPSFSTLSKKIFLILGISSNLILLGYYKYFNLLISGLNQGLSTNYNLHSIILPLAISFFTFTQIAFLVDSYRKETREYSFLHYSLFVTFFPHLIAGPIVHHRQLAPQFTQLRLNSTNVAIGLSLFALGLFKKIILADGLAPEVASIYGAAGTSISTTPDFFAAWAGTISYGMQLYFDFSGYSDMAIGLSLLFGIKLPVNFNSPYKALSIIDFWRRWHITLSTFLRDYLYVPLGGNKKGKTRRYINLGLTMVLGGLWHGASVNFIIWGGLHGFYLLCNHAWRHFRRLKGIEPSNKLGFRVLSGYLTFLALTVAWVFFRSADLHSAQVLLQSMLGLHGFEFSKIIKDAAGNYRILLLILFFLVWAAPNTQQIFSQFNPALGVEGVLDKKWWQFRLSPRVGWIVSIPLFMALLNLFSSAPTEFMYFTF